MTRDSVTVVPTGTANLAAVRAALRRLGQEAVIAEDAGAAADADLVVLPGVGAFASGMEALEAGGFDQAVRHRIDRGLPTLAICLGLQLLCDASEEAPGIPGLGCIPGIATRLPPTVRVPQLGWNEVAGGGDMVRSGVAYYANSYRLVEPPWGWTASYTDYGGRFVAAIERGPVLACQFHPELSGEWGRDLIGRWLVASGRTVAVGGSGAAGC